MGDAATLGRRIAVYGSTGSGKSTLAAIIGERLGLPVVDLDAIHWKPDWVSTPRDEFRTAVTQWLDAHPDGWVCAGNYQSAVGDLVLSEADTVLWLRLPFRVVFWRLLLRTLRRSRKRELLWGTNRESWRRSLLSRDSILLWCITNWRAHVRHVNRALDEVDHKASVLVMRSPGDVKGFLAGL